MALRKISMYLAENGVFGGIFSSVILPWSAYSRPRLLTVLSVDCLAELYDPANRNRNTAYL
jgi:hypothetical protein